MSTTTATTNTNTTTKSSSSSFDAHVYVIAPIYIAWRLYWSNRMPIMDCDEVYNYWEPLHFLQHGTGMQTWEYAPDYALRTYAYLYPLRFIEWILSSLQASTTTSTMSLLQLLKFKLKLKLASLLVDHTVSTEKLATFILMRSTLAGISACCELMFLTALSEQVPFAQSLQRQTLLSPSMSYTLTLVLLSSAGMTHASGALLPSSSVMILWLLAASAYIRLQHRWFSIVAVLATLCSGWPFGVIVFLPMAIDILRRVQPRNQHTFAPLLRLLFEVALWTVMVQAVVMYIDSIHYGKWISPTLNIFQYNAQSGGDELYGIEPTSYYIKNFALNFNYVAFVGLTFLPISFLLRILSRPLPTPLIVMMGSMYIWCVVVVPRPHKEERFLFPIYPALCLGAVVIVQQVWERMVCGASANTQQRWRRHRHVWILFFLPACLVSFSRTLALSKYYTAPLHVYAALPVVPTPNIGDENTPSTRLVCTCGEWYRYPSSYYLPPGYLFGFLPSSFTGQLPKQFEALGSRAGTNFNDGNKEEKDRYVDPNECHYIVELESSKDDSAECIQLMKQNDDDNDRTWTKVVSVPFLNAVETSSLHRILYLPFVHKAEYNAYSLYAKQIKNKNNI